MRVGPPAPREVRRNLLRWFDARRRDLPWRRTRDPYRILVSEYLLQRTRVASGIPYYERFIEQFPDLEALANASEDQVLRAWEGLGFYGRARNLYAAARAIVAHHGGHIPTTAESLRGLPGVGPYTSGAVASIAFGRRVPAIDGNVTRVLSRLYRIEEPVAKRGGRERLWKAASSLVPRSSPGVFNQALMELGATVCTPTSPSCGVCPLSQLCLARKAGIQTSLPRRPRPRNVRTVPVAFGALADRGRVLLVRRARSGLLGGLWSLPGGEIGTDASPRDAIRLLIRDQTGLDVDVEDTGTRIVHAFSHRKWSGAIYKCIPRGGADPTAGATWFRAEEIRVLPLVPFQRKVLDALGFPGGPGRTNVSSAILGGDLSSRHGSVRGRFV